MPRKSPTKATELDSGKTPPGVGGAGSELDSSPSQAGRSVVQVETDPGEPSADFTDFFDTELDGESEYVDVIRIKPELYKGEPATGYCGRLEPGDRYFELKNKFGGGQYRLNVRDRSTGRLVTSGRVTVAGAPILPSDIASAASVRPAVPGANLGSVVDVDIRGTKIPFQLQGPGLEGIKELMLYMRAVDVMFPPRPDISETILAAALGNRRQDDPLELLGKLRAAVPEIFESKGGDGGDAGAGGSNLYDVIKEGLRQAGPVLANMAAGKAPRRPSPMLTAPAAAEPSQLAAGTEVAPGERVESEQVTSDLQIAMQILGEVVKAYRLEPPKAAERVVAMVDLMFQLTPDQKKKLAGYKETAFDLCENQLADVFEESPDSRAGFATWFDQVFAGISGGVS